MKLMTKAIAEQLYQNDQHVTETGNSPENVVVKYFDPCGAATWYVTAGTPLIDEEPTDDIDKADDWHLFGFCTLGDARCAEYGYTLLSQLEEIKGPFGLGIERDTGFGNPPIGPIVNDIKAQA